MHQEPATPVATATNGDRKAEGRGNRGRETDVGKGRQRGKETEAWRQMLGRDGRAGDRGRKTEAERKRCFTDQTIAKRWPTARHYPRLNDESAGRY